MGVKDGWSSKWKVDSWSRVGEEAVGSHAAQPARMLSMSSAGTMAASSCLIASGFCFFGTGLELFFRDRLVPSSSSLETYECLTGVEAIRAEDRVGAIACWGFGFFDGGLLTTL